MSKQTITREQFNQLGFWLSQARNHYSALCELEKRITTEIFPGVPVAPALINAAAFGGISGDELLKRLGVSVEKKK